jgi:hypothetical protein
MIFHLLPQMTNSNQCHSFQPKWPREVKLKATGNNHLEFNDKMTMVMTMTPQVSLTVVGNSSPTCQETPCGVPIPSWPLPLYSWRTRPSWLDHIRTRLTMTWRLLMTRISWSLVKTIHARNNEEAIHWHCTLVALELANLPEARGQCGNFFTG